MNTDFELALEELERDIKKGIDNWADGHIKVYENLDKSSFSIHEYFRILGEYYKAYRKDGFTPCELTFRMWYKINYEQNK